MSEEPPVARIVIGAGWKKETGFSPVTPPLHAADTYGWPDADTKPDYDYSRTVNPNRDMLVEALAALEGAAGGAVTGSGQAAALLALLLLPTGARVVAPHDCYGGTFRLIRGLEDQGKLKACFVDQRDDEAFASAIADGVDLLWIETPSNPLMRIVDIGKRAAEAKAKGALIIADNTLPTPCRQRPLRLGCDLVMHSTTKALNGHGDLFGGALLAQDPALVEKILWWSNAAGLNASAQDCWSTLRGLRTLPLRVDRQESTAIAVADWLAQHEAVLEVHYPGLAGHPDFDLARRQQTGPGFLMSFRLRGGEDSTRPFLAALETIRLASSLGNVASLICKPATMTHRGMPPEAQAEAGIHPDLLRLSIGLEDPADLIADLERAFASAG